MKLNVWALRIPRWELDLANSQGPGYTFFCHKQRHAYSLDSGFHFHPGSQYFNRLLFIKAVFCFIKAVFILLDCFSWEKMCLQNISSVDSTSCWYFVVELGLYSFNIKTLAYNVSYTVPGSVWSSYLCDSCSFSFYEVSILTE